MPKKSHRVSLHDKYKIQKKVKEHHRKIRKLAKKNPYKKRMPKDPGIPNIYPFKGKLLDKLKEQTEKEKEDKKRIMTEGPKVQLEMEKLRSKAEKKQEEYENQLLLQVHAKKTLDSIPDSSRRTFFKEFKKVISSADVILEVLDARDPLGCRCPAIEKMILKKDANKKIVLVLNKIDLTPKKVVEQWLKYFRNEYPTVAFKCSTQSQKENLKQGKREISDVSGTDFMLKGSECLGADVLIQLLKNYCRNKGIKTAITVGIIGYPNVGKSSLINSLKRKRVTTVGSTPGVTTDIQEITLDKQIKLLDCPGIVFSSGSDSNSDVVLRNCVKIEQLEDPVFPVDAILKRCHKIQLLELYKIPNFENTQQFLSLIAKKKGKLTKGGIPNYKASAISVLKDWNSGKIKYYSVPPEEKTEHISATIVSTWAKEFDLDSITNLERMEVVEKLDDLKETNFLSISSTTVDDSNFYHKLESISSKPEINNNNNNNINEMNDINDDSDANDDMNDESSSVEEQHISSSNTNNNNNKIALSKKEKRSQTRNILDEEDQFNPQVNKNKKKIQKSERKKKKKLLLAQLAAATENNENYNFTTDFIGIKNATANDINSSEQEEIEDDDEDSGNQNDENFNFDI